MLGKTGVAVQPEAVHMQSPVPGAAIRSVLQMGQAGWIPSIPFEIHPADKVALSSQHCPRIQLSVPSAASREEVVGRFLSRPGLKAPLEPVSIL